VRNREPSHASDPQVWTMLTRLMVLTVLSLGYAASAAARDADLAQSPVADGGAARAVASDSLPDGPADEIKVPDEAATAIPRVDAPGVKGRGPRHSQRLTAEQIIDGRVRRLAKALELDEAQQARLREVLRSERQQINSMWRENPHPAADRVGPMLAILDRTREEIRAMLTEEQSKKYPAAVPRGSTAPANADLDYWMRLTQPAPREDGVRQTDPLTTD
jgi:hypothetical protein